MSLTLYELCGADDRRFSPYCWRIRMALAHKGLDPERVPVRFTEKDRIAFSGQKLVPVLVDGDTTVVDSFAIACYLDDAYPDRPTLFGKALGRSLSKFFMAWLNTEVQPGLLGLIIKDIHDHLDAPDQDYFRETRTQRFGRGLDEIQADRDQKIADFRKSLTPARNILADQKFLCGEEAAGADYFMFGTFQWAHTISPFVLLAEDDPVFAWRGRMLDLFDGLAAAEPGYPLA